MHIPKTYVQALNSLWAFYSNYPDSFSLLSQLTRWAPAASIGGSRHLSGDSRISAQMFITATPWLSNCRNTTASHPTCMTQFNLNVTMAPLHTVVNHRFPLMCDFLFYGWGKPQRQDPPLLLSSWHMTFRTRWPKGLGELTSEELGVRICSDVGVPAIHLPRGASFEREQSQRAVVYAELHVTAQHGKHWAC